MSQKWLVILLVSCFFIIGGNSFSTNPGKQQHNQKQAKQSEANNYLNEAADYLVEHSFGIQSEYQKRGLISFGNPKAIGFSQSHSKHIVSDDIDFQTLEQFCLSHPEDFYRMRIKIEENVHITSSIKAKYMLEAVDEKGILHDLLTISVNDAAQPISFSYSIENNSDDKNNDRKVNGLLSKVKVHMGAEAPKTRTDISLPPPSPPQKGLLAKYWYIILPVGLLFVINMFMGNNNESRE